ncbi:none [Leptomonas seymouri]|uniref:None n=1 Tax=Leptomonas seymouri TaxID=5684 RepID=A0A0N1PBS5_LEPSE|nr:none [Leptomonas seymouri]|eukprot:KPI86133.1 none [Leptomonas seymouri]
MRCAVAGEPPVCEFLVALPRTGHACEIRFFYIYIYIFTYTLLSIYLCISHSLCGTRAMGPCGGLPLFRPSPLPRHDPSLPSPVLLSSRNFVYAMPSLIPVLFSFRFLCLLLERRLSVAGGGGGAFRTNT